MGSFDNRRLIFTLSVSIAYSLLWLFLRKVLKLNATKTRLVMLLVMVLLVLGLSQGWFDGLLAQLRY